MKATIKTVAEGHEEMVGRRVRVFAAGRAVEGRVIDTTTGDKGTVYVGIAADLAQDCCREIEGDWHRNFELI